jgi:hypothetical protein
MVNYFLEGNTWSYLIHLELFSQTVSITGVPQTVDTRRTTDMPSTTERRPNDGKTTSGKIRGIFIFIFRISAAFHTICIFTGESAGG